MHKPSKSVSGFKGDNFSTKTQKVELRLAKRTRLGWGKGRKWILARHKVKVKKSMRDQQVVPLGQKIQVRDR